jgi:hypothetical protein
VSQARPKDRFASHDRVDNSEKEYARYEEGRPTIHTNTVEGYFSVFKRGMRGTYQHCKEKHLHRYLAEFDFRYNNRSALNVGDNERATKAVVGAKGKRLTYRQPTAPDPEVITRALRRGHRKWPKRKARGRVASPWHHYPVRNDKNLSPLAERRRRPSSKTFRTFERSLQKMIRLEPKYAGSALSCAAFSLRETLHSLPILAWAELRSEAQI